MTVEDLGKQIRQRRKALGMSQADLALASGSGLRFIGEVERGKSTAELGKVLEVLGNLGLEIILEPKGAR